MSVIIKSGDSSDLLHVNVDKTLPVAISGTVPLPTGASTSANQTTELASLSSIDSKTPALNAGSISLGTSFGKSAVLKTGTLVTTATTIDQIVLTYTVTALKTFYLEYLDLFGRLTAVSATASILGTISVETPSGTKVFTASLVNPTTSDSGSQRAAVPLVEPIPIPAGAVIRVVVTPAAVTSMTWLANFGGYEK